MIADSPFVTPYQIETAIVRAREERAAAIRAGLLRFGRKVVRAVTGFRPQRGRLPLTGLAAPRA